MVDYNEMYHPTHDNNIKVEKEVSCSTRDYILLGINIIFAFIIIYMMITMIHILQHMDQLMKSTTYNTYNMCELTKKISFNNTTKCNAS